MRHQTLPVGLEDRRAAEALRCHLDSMALCCLSSFVLGRGTCSEAGLSDSCPDMAKAVNTWQFAIKTLKKARLRFGRTRLHLFQHLAYPQMPHRALLNP